MSDITILLLYLLAAVAFTLQCLPAHAARSGPLLSAALIFSVAALLFHGQSLAGAVVSEDGLHFSIAATLSLIGLQLGLIGVLGAVEASLRGMSAGLLALAAIVLAISGYAPEDSAGSPMTWQMQAHILVSVFAYGLLTVGAIVAVYALVQDRRLRSGQLSAANHLFAPLETTERLLFGITAGGFAALLLAVVSGFMFVDDLFAQHLVHKTALSLLALMLFGLLVAGRQFAGWRGKRAVYLYLWGFFILCLAYFGSRYILEQVLGRSWG